MGPTDVQTNGLAESLKMIKKDTETFVSPSSVALSAGWAKSRYLSA